MANNILNELNLDMILAICEYLIPQDIAALFLTCKQANAINYMKEAYGLQKNKFETHFLYAAADVSKRNGSYYHELNAHHKYAKEKSYCNLRLHAMAREGDIESLKAILDDQNKWGELKALFTEDYTGTSPFAYARKHKQQAWLNYCYDNILGLPNMNFETLTSPNRVELLSKIDGYNGNAYSFNCIKLDFYVITLWGAIQTLQPSSDIIPVLQKENFFSKDDFSAFTQELKVFLFFTAVQCGHLDLVKDILKLNPNMVNVRREGNRPLSIAVQNGDDDMIDLLERSGSGYAFNNWGAIEAAFYVALKNNNVTAITRLLHHAPGLTHSTTVAYNLAHMPHVNSEIRELIQNNSFKKSNTI